MNLSQLIKNLFQLTTTKIIEFVNKEIEGKEKKAEVDVFITNWLTENISKLGIIQQFVVAQYVIPTVPIITQAIYDSLAKKIEGLTV